MLDIYGKTDVPSMGHGRIEIAGVVLQGDDVTKLSNILDGHYRPKGSALDDTAGEQVQIPQDQNTGSVDPKLVIEQNIADAKMTALMSQTLTQKEEIIKALEAQLESEKVRRKDHEKDYKTTLKEYKLDKKALDNLKKQSDILERQQ